MRTIGWIPEKVEKKTEVKPIKPRKPKKEVSAMVEQAKE